MAHENRRFFSPFFATGGTYPETETAIASTRLSCGRDAKGRDAVCRRLTAAWHRPANLGDHQPGQGTGYACAQRLVLAHRQLHLGGTRVEEEGFSP